MNDYLTASNSHLNDGAPADARQPEGRRRSPGNNLGLTIDSKAQQVALDALGDNCGAAVAIEPSTGRCW